MREAILELRLITAKRRALVKKTAITFINVEKAFDNVNFKITFRVLERLGV